MRKNIIEEIYKSVVKFLEPLTLEDTYKIITNELIKLTQAKYGSVFLNKGHVFQKVFSTSPVNIRIIPRKRGFSYQAYKLGKILTINQKQLLSAHPEIKNFEKNIKSRVFIPLSYEKKSIGVIALAFKEKDPQINNDLEVLKLFGSFASLIIRKMQLHHETKNALKTRDLFISLAAHELKTPLTTISAYVQLLEKKLPEIPELNSRWINQLSTSTNRLTKLINQFLHINQIKTGQLKYYWKECDLKEIINQAVLDFRIFHKKHVLKFWNEVPTIQTNIIADSDKLLEALTNVLNNSVKFSSINSQIDIRLNYKLPYFIISIQDRGKGISPEILPKVFHKFYQENNLQNGGMGLGLFLTKEIIKQHQGKITINSQINEGTLVKIRLPKKNCVGT